MGNDDIEVVIPSDMSIDFWIEVIINEIKHGSAGPKERGQLKNIVSTKGYNGTNPNIMLSLYDILEMPKGLEYGIRGFETLKRDPKIITQLKNPDGLVGYLIDTSDSLDELVRLQEIILRDGSFYNFYPKLEDIKDKKRLANSLLLVANEIAYEQRIIKQHDILVEAHTAIVLGHYALTNASEKTLDALSALNKLVNVFMGRFPITLLDEYFKYTHRVDSPVKGKVPEELKADHDWGGAMQLFGNYEGYFKNRYFGEKEFPKARKTKEEAQQEAIKGLDLLFNDPWAYFKEHLSLLGLHKGMSYEQARSTYRTGINQRRSTFTRMDTETSEYKKAMKETTSFLDAWKQVRPLYQIKERNANQPA